MASVCLWLTTNRVRDFVARVDKKLGEAKGLRSVTTLNKPVRMAALQDALNLSD